MVKPVTQTAAQITQAIAEVVKPVTQTEAETTQAVTEVVKPVTQTAAQITQAVTEVVKPVAQTAAKVTQVIAKFIKCVTKAVEVTQSPAAVIQVAVVQIRVTGGPDLRERRRSHCLDYPGRGQI